MQSFRTLDAVAAPLPVANVDTDQIIPARFLARPRSAGYADQLFHDLRIRPDGSAEPGFVLNDPGFAGAAILVADRNFGCGSSRETAVWALMDYGIRCVVAPSFGDIFFNNSFKNGLLPIVLPQAEIDALLAALAHRQDIRISIDLAEQTLDGPGGAQTFFTVPAFEKRMLLQGLDELGMTLDLIDGIHRFELGYDAERYWLETSKADRSTAGATERPVVSTDRSTEFPLLFQPVRLGPKVARNRIMRVATTANLAVGNRVGPRMLAFYRTLAQGGVGTIVTESLRVHRADTEPAGCIRMWEDESIPGMRELADTVHEAGALLIGQLNHAGRQHIGRTLPGRLLAPSPLPCPRSGGVPHELDADEVVDLVEDFAAAAARCATAGLDGVEVHGAQGHLIQQFLSPYSNIRTDRYGGSFLNRARFARDILAAIRGRLGPGFVLGYRMGVEEFTPGGFTIEDAESLAALFAKDGPVDYLSLSQGNFNSKTAHLPDRHMAQVPYRTIQARIRPAAGSIPVVMCTSIQTAEQGEELIAAGETDLVGYCRAFIVDPAWPSKAQAGRLSEVRRCIACNQCWGWIADGAPIGCAINPTAGREHEWGALTHAAVRKKVAVVGGGPAGMEAARVAALRGHDVVLFERADVLGGKVARAARAPHHAELDHAVTFLDAQVRAAGVQLRLGVDADAGLVAAEHPDVIVVATGATPIAPTLPGDGSVPVLTCDVTIAADQLAPEGDTIVVMDEDGYFWPAAVTEALARLGRRIIFLTRQFEPFREMPSISRIATMREMDLLGVEFRPNTVADRVERGTLVLRHYQSGRETSVPRCAALVWIGPQAANDALAVRLRGTPGVEVALIGDAFAPRRLPHAIREGHALGRKL